MELTFEVVGATQIKRTLDRFQDRLMNMQPVFEGMAGSFADLEQRLFTRQGRSGGIGAAGRGWSELSVRYGKWKARHYPGAPLLVRAGDMRRELTRQAAGRFGVEDIGEHSMEIGTALARARYHQTGTDTMPQRKVVDTTQNWRREQVKRLQRFLIEADAGQVGLF